MIAGGREWLRVLELRVREAGDALRDALEHEQTVANALSRARMDVAERTARLRELSERERQSGQRQVFELAESARFEAEVRAALSEAQTRLRAEERATERALTLTEQKRDELAALRAEAKALENHLDETERDAAKAVARKRERSG